MKIVQAAALVLIGVLGAMVYNRMSSDPQPAQVAEAPAPAASPVEPEPAPAPVVTPEPGPTPVRTPARQARPRNEIARRDQAPVAPPPSAPSAPVFQPSQPASPPPAPEPPPARVIEPSVAPAPPPPPPPRRVTVAAGTILPVRLIETVSSDKNKPGDTFTASLEEPLVVDGFVIAERGSRVAGRVVETQQAGRVRGVSSIALELTSIDTSDGQTVEIATDSHAQTGPQSKGSDAAKIGGAAAIGAAIGAIAGGGKGAAIGAGIGGAAGTGGVMATRGKPAVVPSETRLSFRLSNSVTITERRRGR